MGFYTVKDRIFGPKEDAQHPDQGGSSFYIDAVHYFPNGFLAAADVNITSNLAFRQIFSDSIQQAISPEERSQVFINKNYHAYSFNFRLNTQATSLQNSQIRIRELPSVSLDRRPSPLPWFKNIPVYYSFESAVEGVSRKETPGDLATFRAEAGRDPIITPSIVQRFDFHPNLSVPLNFSGWSLTATAGARATYYSNSIDPTTRLVSPRDVVRGYGEFELDLRPPALARNFRRSDGSVWFRHVIEPYLIYRRVAGIDNFNRIIRFDYVDAIADTNEIEYGISNRFYTRRSTETVGKKAERAAREKKSSLATQPYEALTITVRGKYFFDPYFGGALFPAGATSSIPSILFPDLVMERCRASSRPSTSTSVIARQSICSPTFALTSIRTVGVARHVRHLWPEPRAGPGVLDLLLHAGGRTGAEAATVRRRERAESRARCAARNGALRFFWAIVTRDCSAGFRSSLIFRSTRLPAAIDLSSVRRRPSAIPGNVARSRCRTTPSTWACVTRIDSSLPSG